MIEFIYADVLKSRFKVAGRFYDFSTNDGTKIPCRSLLTISDTAQIQVKELTIVMLNPGSSRPADEKTSVPEITSKTIGKLKDVDLVEAKPDNTQYQIMRLMLKLNYSHANILNLSDVREPQSGRVFENTLNNHYPKEICLFDNSRKEEFKSYFTNENHVVFAWGNTDSLSQTEKKAIQEISFYTQSLYAAVGSDGKIYHASPSRKDFKLRWLESICEQIGLNKKFTMSF